MDETSLFGKEWLLTYKQRPTSGVSLLRCHYEHDGSDVDNLYSGELVPPPAVVSSDTEVRPLLVSLPDSTDPSLWRCPGGQAVASFDVYTARDQSGLPVAKFQTSEGGNGCGTFRVLPSI